MVQRQDRRFGTRNCCPTAMDAMAPQLKMGYGNQECTSAIAVPDAFHSYSERATSEIRWRKGKLFPGHFVEPTSLCLRICCKGMLYR